MLAFTTVTSFFEVSNNSKPDINESNENIILIFRFLTSSFLRLLKNEKPDVRIGIITLVIFFFTGYSVKDLQANLPYQDINVCSRSQFFIMKLINKFKLFCIYQLHLQSILM